MTIGQPRTITAAGRDTAEHATDLRRGARALARISLAATGVNGEHDLEPLGERLADPAARLSENAASLVEVARLYRTTDAAQVRSLSGLLPLLPHWE